MVKAADIYKVNEYVQDSAVGESECARRDCLHYIIDGSWRIYGEYITGDESEYQYR